MKETLYAKFFKRLIDFFISLTAFAVLLPLILILSATGAAAMHGNPFFVQERPGKNEKIFRLIKFRTMTNEKDPATGDLLPDEKRLRRYGRWLRKTSLDELPSLINIIKGDMALVGPRPLLVRYLQRYSEAQRHRHDVRPGLTGYAQTHGRNAVSWEERFDMDIWYTKNVTFKTDMRILFKTVGTILKREGISSGTSETMEEFMGTEENAETKKEVRK